MNIKTNIRAAFEKTKWFIYSSAWLEIHALLKLMVYKAISFLMPSDFESTEKALTKVMELVEKIIPDSELKTAIDRFIVIEKNGGLKDIAQDRVDDCANKLGMEIEQSKKIVACLQNTFESDEDNINKMLTLANCCSKAQVKVSEILYDAVEFAECLGRDALNDIQDEL